MDDDDVEEEKNTAGSVPKALLVWRTITPVESIDGKVETILRMLIYHPATATANHTLMYALTTILLSKNSLVKVNKPMKGN